MANFNGRFPIIASACFWAIACIVISYALRQQPALMVGGAILLLSGAVLALRMWSDRRHDDRTLRLTWVGIVLGAAIIASWTSGGWWSLWFDAWFIWEAWRSFIDTVDREDGQIRTVSVRARELTGAVEYDSMHCSGILVEEYSSDWKQRFSEIKTDDNGRFAVPHTIEGPLHYLKISWPGTTSVHLRVEIAAHAQPLLVRLKPRKPKEMGNWGE